MPDRGACAAPPTESLLLAAVRAAPRRYRLPPLPADLRSAAASEPEVALAFAIEAARVARDQHAHPPPAVGELFTASIARLIATALQADGGDASFQALVLRAQQREVDEHVRLSALKPADRRALRAATDAFAHPGKLRDRRPGALRDALERLHQLAAQGPWDELAQALRELLACGTVDEPTRMSLQAIADSPALQRLLRGTQLLELDAVRRYLALCEQRGPLAGSHSAAAQGRASARNGDAAERLTVDAFRAIAGLLDTAQGTTGAHRVVRSLRTPRGFPGDSGKAKDEWDAAIVHLDAPAAGARLLLLAEVKASPAAATPDYSRLHRGLQRLAHAEADASYRFPSADGDVEVTGDSLRALLPQGRAMPPQVVYCCSAPLEAQPQVLSAATKAVLLTEPLAVAFAQQLVHGANPPHEQLAPIWQALATQPRLRSALHQYETACAARQAMLHPEDLLACVRQQMGAAA